MSAPSLKRFFDIAGACLGLVLLFPLGLLIGLLVKLADRGPIFYGQTRIGQRGKPFRIWKFRSMVVNAENMGALVTYGEDPRITPLGRFLRRTKLDELPQLWNVLLGEMTLVGPRPEVPKYVALYTPKQREILQYKPGITDVATLLFRNEELLLNRTEEVEAFYVRYCLPKKIELNREYAERATLPQDVWIILQTLCPYWLAVLAVYAVALTFSFWLAYQLHADFQATARDYAEFKRLLPLILLPQLLFLVWRGQLRGLLSYFSIPEMRRTVLALAAAGAVQIALCWALARPAAPSPSILLMDFLLSFFVICAARMALRMQREWFSRPRTNPAARAVRVAIIGTGERATNLLLDYRRSEHPVRRRVVAFFDDNPRTWNKRPHNVPVIGMPECLLTKEWLSKIDEVVVTIPREDSSRISEIETMLKDTPYKVMIASGWPTLGRDG